jgi:protein gp37
MNVPFFFKQWGGVRKKAAGRELSGRTFDEMPRAQLRQKSIPLPLELDSICK